MATAEQLQDLKDQLAALERDGFARDAELGAKLHAEKNAPWVNGPYSHLKFPPYVFKAFPKMLFGPDYLKACDEFEMARRMRESRDDPTMKPVAIAAAQKRKDEATRIVRDLDEQQALGSLWQETPQAAVDAQEALAREVAEAARVAAYDDRRLGAAARVEREAADAASKGHLVEVPRSKPGNKIGA